MKTGRLWLLLVLLQTTALFTLGILGNQIAAQFELPLPILIFTALGGLLLTGALSFWLLRPESLQEIELASSLGLREVIRRLTVRPPRRLFFGPQYTEKQENMMFGWAFLVSVFAGIPTVFIVNGFPGDFRALEVLGLLLMVAFIPIFLLIRRQYSGTTFSRIGEGLVFLMILALIQIASYVSFTGVWKIVVYGISKEN